MTKTEEYRTVWKGDLAIDDDELRNSCWHGYAGGILDLLETAENERDALKYRHDTLKGMWTDEMGWTEGEVDEDIDDCIAQEQSHS